MFCSGKESTGWTGEKFILYWLILFKCNKFFSSWFILYCNCSSTVLLLIITLFFFFEKSSSIRENFRMIHCIRSFQVQTFKFFPILIYPNYISDVYLPRQKSIYLCDNDQTSVQECNSLSKKDQSSAKIFLIIARNNHVISWCYLFQI